MSDKPSSPSDIDSPLTLATLSLLSGMMSTVLFVFSLQPVTQDPAQLLIAVADHRLQFAAQAIAVLVWAVVSVPCVVAVGQLLRPRSHSLALAATILSSGGILLLAYSIRTYLGAAFAILAASPRLDAPEVIYQAAIWRNLSFMLTDPGLMTWGVGQSIFGLLARKSGLLPKWLAWVGIVGGLAGVLTDAVYQSGALALIQLASFAVWGFTIGKWLLNRR